MTTQPGEHPLPDEVDALLDDAGEPGLRAHVDACAHCQALLRRQRELRDLLAGLAGRPPVPAQVSERWFSTLAAEPAFRIAPGTGQLDDGPPDFSPWLGAMSGSQGSPGRDRTDRHPRSTPTRAGAPGAPGARHPSTPPDGASRPIPRPLDPGRVRHLRMAVALAAGFTLLVGAGAATWTTFNRQGSTTSAAEAAPSAAASAFDGNGQERTMRDEQDTSSAEGPAGRADALLATEPHPLPPPAGDTDSVPAPPDAPRSVSEDQVRAAVASRDLRWPGATSAADARQRAHACLRVLGMEHPVLAALPGSGEGTDTQVIVSEEGDRWRVSEVSTPCPPGDTTIRTTFITP